MFDITLKPITAEEMVKEAQTLTHLAMRMAKASWVRYGELARRDPDLITRSEELITAARQRLGT